MTAKKKQGKPKKAKKCCPHCQDYKQCDDKRGCCEYCDFQVKENCTYSKEKKKKIDPGAVLDTSTSYAFDNFRGDNYGIDDYEEYDGYEG